MEKVKVIINSTNILDKEETQINCDVDGKLIKSGNYYILSYLDELNNNDQVIIKYNDEKIIIKKNGDFKSKLVFNKVGASYGIYEINQRDMKLNMELINFKSEEKLINLEYKLMIQDNEAGHFNIEINIIK